MLLTIVLSFTWFGILLMAISLLVSAYGAIRRTMVDDAWNTVGNIGVWVWGLGLTASVTILLLSAIK